MNYKTITSLTLAFLLLGGCVFAPGDWDDDGNRNRGLRPTVGQELLDLDRARDAGLLSEAEYERARDRILDR